MKRTLSLFTFLCVFMVISAQSFNVKKASKAVLTLKTFKADGSLLGSSCGFFIGEDGHALSCFTPFRDAYSAVVIDAQGREWPVQAMLGANETYDVAKFQVGIAKPQGLTVAPTDASTGEQVWLLPYHAGKVLPQGEVRRVEYFSGNNAYYTISLPLQDSQVSCPLLTPKGEVVGIMQPSANAADSLSYAVSALYADSLRMTGLSINDRALRSTHIKKALPREQDQALLTLYVAGSSLDSASYVNLVNDFITQFPKSADGYTYRAQLKMQANDFAGAQKDMEQSIAAAEKKDEAHYNYSRLVYQKEIYQGNQPYEPWSLNLSLQEVRKAYELNPQPIYRHHEAQVLYAQKQYANAFTIYDELVHSSLRSAELFYEASRCKIQLRDTIAQLALLDSALSMFSQPYLQEAAPYLLARAQALMDAGKWRSAVSDLNSYEPLMRSRIGANFYYIRYQAEVGARLFKQALEDIDRAIGLASDYDLYYAEKASLQVRVGLYEEAIGTASQCIKLAPDHSDGYLFLGLAQCLIGEKADGIKNLQKAKELGDAQADDLIVKYGGN